MKHLESQSNLLSRHWFSYIHVYTCICKTVESYSNWTDYSISSDDIETHVERAGEEVVKGRSELGSAVRYKVSQLETLWNIYYQLIFLPQRCNRRLTVIITLIVLVIVAVTVIVAVIFICGVGDACNKK